MEAKCNHQCYAKLNKIGKTKHTCTNPMIKMKLPIKFTRKRSLIDKSRKSHTHIYIYFINFKSPIPTYYSK